MVYSAQLGRSNKYRAVRACRRSTGRRRLRQGRKKRYCRLATVGRQLFYPAQFERRVSSHALGAKRRHSNRRRAVVIVFQNPVFKKAVFRSIGKLPFIFMFFSEKTQKTFRKT